MGEALQWKLVACVVALMSALCACSGTSSQAINDAGGDAADGSLDVDPGAVAADAPGDVRDVEPDSDAEPADVVSDSTDVFVDGDPADTEVDAADVDDTGEADVADSDAVDATDVDAAGSSDVADGDDVMDVSEDPDLDTADDVGSEYPECLPVGYRAYLASVPDVAASALGELDALGVEVLCAHLDELETTGVLSIPEPAGSVACVEPTSCRNVFLTDEERRSIHAGRIAHALWLDFNQLVPWSLADWDVGELVGLWGINVVFTSMRFDNVVDHNPSPIYAYLVDAGLVGATAEETFEAVLADLRTTDEEIDFLHGLASRDPTNTAVTLEDALTETTDVGGSPARVSRAGCHSMTRILLGVLRAANIPGYERHDAEWYLPGHSTAEWPVLGYVLSHGDNVYSASYRAAPAIELVADYGWYSQDPADPVCGSDPGCLGFRHAALAMTTWPSNYFVQRCCNPAVYELDSCEAFLRGDYGAYLTEDELLAGIAAGEALCP